jgi:DNA-directed RNA polymerase subunit RPC12/RpoP
MDCLVCTQEVKDLTPLTYKGLVVGCPRCGIYRIMQSAVAALRRLRTEQRLAALQRAKDLRPVPQPSHRPIRYEITRSEKSRRGSVSPPCLSRRLTRGSGCCRSPR